ncbi:probable tRNA methyltransferase 9B [Anguilla rostrata]|uniref:probable tRNA methyltransferase 9B n=1 Tax=Anguilla rostrata TaxID=7938 RepID=UPI0030CBF6D5
MEEAASQLERDHVHSVYEKIAPYFNDSRYRAWPKVRQFLLDQEPGSVVADVGCGNGKYLDINEDAFKLGCDVCRPLVDTACARGYEVQVCDGLRLPYRRGCFDAVLSIAVIHHLSTKERRIRALREMARVLRVGGRLMVYVWAMEQKRRKFEKQDVFIPWNPNPPASPASGRRWGGGGGDADDGDKHRKAKSTSSMADEDEDPARAKDPRSPKDQRWFFSRSLDSVLDFGSLATPKHPARELNLSCAQMGEVGGLKAYRRARGVGLIRQFSSIFSSSSITSLEEDVFGSALDLGGGGRERSDGRPAGDKQAVFGAIVGGCSSVPLPDLVTHQRESPEGTGRGEADGEPRGEPQGAPPQRQASSESIRDGRVNRWGGEKPADPCLRYYHVFREGELLELIQNHVEELHVLQSCLDHSNWCVVAEKVRKI